MRASAKIVYAVVVALFGVASAVLGFVAEGTRLKPDDIDAKSRGGCVYPASPAFGLALCAACLLGVAQIVASAAGGCCNCCRPGTTGVRAPKSMRILGVITSVLSWIAALFALDIYLLAALLNAPATQLRNGDGECDYHYLILSGGAFVRATVLSLVATAFGIASYIMLTSAPVPKPEGHPLAVGMQQYPAGQAPPGPQLAPPPGQDNASVNA